MKKKNGAGKTIRRFMPFYLMMIPGLLYLLINNYIPMAGLVMAFEKYNVRGGMFGSPFCGLPTITASCFSRGCIEKGKMLQQKGSDDNKVSCTASISASNSFIYNVSSPITVNAIPTILSASQATSNLPLPNLKSAIITRKSSLGC